MFVLSGPWLLEDTDSKKNVLFKAVSVFSAEGQCRIFIPKSAEVRDIRILQSCSCSSKKSCGISCHPLPPASNLVPKESLTLH